MKKLFFVLIISASIISCKKDTVAASSTSTTTQTNTEDHVGTPPAVVSSAFTANFGNVAVSQWKERNDGTWTAHFTNNGVAWEATFKADGTLVKSERA